MLKINANPCYDMIKVIFMLIRDSINYSYRKVGIIRNFGGKCATLYLTNYSLEKEKLLIKYPQFPKLRIPIKVKFPSQEFRFADL